MKVVRIISRLDYPICFTIIDKLGDYLEFIQTQLKIKSIKNAQCNIDLLNHIIYARSENENGFIYLEAGLKNITTVAEYKKGIDVDSIGKNPVVELADLVATKMDLSGSIPEYTRFGLRAWMIDTDYKYKNIVDVMSAMNNKTVGILNKSGFETKDIGLIIDAVDDKSQSGRFAFGPYQKKESLKYFEKETEFDEGLILDFDISQSKISIPGFSYVKQANRYQKIFATVSVDIKEIFAEVKK